MRERLFYPLYKRAERLIPTFGSYRAYTPTPPWAAIPIAHKGGEKAHLTGGAIAIAAHEAHRLLPGRSQLAHLLGQCAGCSAARLPTSTAALVIAVPSTNPARMRAIR